MIYNPGEPLCLELFLMLELYGAGPYSDVGTQITHQGITTTTTNLLGKYACIAESYKQNSRNPDFGT